MIATDGSTVTTIETTTNTTIDGLLAAFAAAGVQAHIEEGVIKFNDDNTRHVEDATDSTILEKLEIGTYSSTVVKDIFKASSAQTVQYTTTEKKRKGFLLKS